MFLIKTEKQKYIRIIVGDQSVNWTLLRAPKKIKNK